MTPDNCTFAAVRRQLIRLAALTVLLALAGCASFFTDYSSRQGVSSSVVDYLYPSGEEFEPVEAGIPEIRLPARVGLMFVPSTRAPIGLGATDKQALLNQVRDAFSAHEFIERIEVVPDTYLRPRGGFENLEQVARLHGLDIVALVSYDQLINSEESAASFLYWTIIGAYTIPATANQVSTFVDTTVLDVRTRTLLFRAPGQDQRGGGSSAVRTGDVQTRLSREGFQHAVNDMIVNLDRGIGDFGVRVREEGQVRLVDRRSGREWSQRSGGSGSLRMWELGILMLLGIGLMCLRRRG